MREGAECFGVRTIASELKRYTVRVGETEEHRIFNY
jgi:hypothetical protein